MASRSSPSSSSSTSSNSPNTYESSSKTSARKRPKYSRPCDACAYRRIRCDLHDGEGKTRCTSCINHNLDCTNNRVRQKSGPKKIHSKTREMIRRFANTSTNSNNSHVYIASISIENIIPFLQVYQTWWYGIWPVLSISYIVASLMANKDNSGTNSNNSYIKLNKLNYSTYCLSCCLSAAVAVQVSFLSSHSNVTSISPTLDASEYIEEALRVRSLFNYATDLNSDNLLSSFFLYVYYVNTKGGTNHAVLYLREAISLSHLLGYHDIHTFKDKTPAEVHKLRKIYYTLLVSERFMCFEEKVPIVLSATIPMPSLEDEEYPALLEGFTELIKVFSAPDQKFFEEINKKDFEDRYSYNDKMTLLKDFLQIQSNSFKRDWLVNLQKKFESVSPSSKVSDVQKLNISLTQAWFKALTWHITRENNLLTNDYDSKNCLSVSYPIDIAQRFLREANDLPLFAYETNGPGVAVKLLEIANSLSMCLYKVNVPHGYDILKTIFETITMMKNDITLPISLYNKIGDFLNESQMKSIPKIINEIYETKNNNNETNNEHSRGIERVHSETNLITLNSQGNSPFTQISMAFGLSPDTLGNFSNGFPTGVNKIELLNENADPDFNEYSGQF